MERASTSSLACSLVVLSVVLAACVSGCPEGGPAAVALVDGGGADGDAASDGASVDAGASSDGDVNDFGEASDAPIFPVDEAGDSWPSSCLAIKTAKPTSSDGTYTLDGDGAGPAAPFNAYCDMTTDAGGWMLINSAMIDHEDGKFTTVVKSADARGGLIMQVYANQNGCVDDSRHQVVLKNIVPWTKLRADYVFAGSTSCWGILGNGAYATGLTSGLHPFDKALDVIRDQKRMGGSAGDAFDGTTSRCDNETTNFWHTANGVAPRSASAILRRISATAVSGLTLGITCTLGDVGTTSPTWWRYSNVYVR